MTSPIDPYQAPSALAPAMRGPKAVSPAFLFASLLGASVVVPYVVKSLVVVFLPSLAGGGEMLEALRQAGVVASAIHTLFAYLAVLGAYRYARTLRTGMPILMIGQGVYALVALLAVLQRASPRPDSASVATVEAVGDVALLSAICATSFAHRSARGARPVAALGLLTVALYAFIAVSNADSPYFHMRTTMDDVADVLLLAAWVASLASLQLVGRRRGELDGQPLNR